MPELFDRGALDLRWLIVAGEPIAVSYSIIQDNRVYYYQGGRSTSVPKGVRPGTVLHLQAIRAAIAAGREEYDFLGGDARYKLQLATACRPLFQLRVARPSYAEAARVAVDASRLLIHRTWGAVASLSGPWAQCKGVATPESDPMAPPPGGAVSPPSGTAATPASSLQGAHTARSSAHDLAE